MSDEFYEMTHSGEELDAAVTAIGKIHKGTQTIIVQSGLKMAYNQIMFGGYTPSMVVGNLRLTTTPNPFLNICCSIVKGSTGFNTLLTMGPNSGSTTIGIPAGTYYFDYIAIE